MKFEREIPIGLDARRKNDGGGGQNAPPPNGIRVNSSANTTFVFCTILNLCPYVIAWL